MAARNKAKKSTRARKTSPKARPTNGARAAAPPWRTVTPYLAVSDAARAIDWYKEALGAREIARMPAPGGKIMHAELMIGDSRVMLSDVFPGSDLTEPTQLGGTGAGLHLTIPAVDRAWKRAVAAGATVTMPLENQFWGDRYGKLRDPFGHSWSLSFPARMTEAEKKQKERQAMETFAAGAHP